MRYLKNTILLVFIWLCINAAAQSQRYTVETSTAITYNKLHEGFTKTPDESGLRCYWWWLNSMATKESITRDLEQMKAKGYEGATIFDAGSSNYRVARKTAAGPVFMSPQWMELYQHAVREAERIGIELSVNVQSGWNPGAPSITPEMALKKLVYTETEVKGGRSVQIELLQPETKLLYRDVMVQAIPMPSKKSPVKNNAITNWDKKSFKKTMGWRGIYPLHELREGFNNPVEVDIIKKKAIVDLTANFDGKQLKWEAPEGDWLVIRFGWTCTGAQTSTTSNGWGGLSLDHLNPDAFELFGKTVIQPLIDSARAVGNSIKFLQTDSWEMGTVNWTNRFPEEFKKFRGYELDKYLPVMTGRVVESQDVSNRFLHDIRKTVGDCVAAYHYQLFASLAHKHGMGIHPESGGPHSAPVDALKVMGISNFPQGEFWARSNTHRVSDADRLAVKQSAFVAHTNVKRFVAAEGPTSIGPHWERPPSDLKNVIDRIFCAGVNRIVWHTFTSSPKEFGLPGNEYFAGTHLNTNVTWWNQAGDFISYLNRCSFMLQQGLFVADILYYYGDDVPNFVFLKDEYKELKFGYNWDKCSKDILLDRVSVENGELVLSDDMSYRILVLPDEEAINLEVLKKVEEFVKQGLTVISPRPVKATGLTNYPESDHEIEAIAKRMWGNVDGENITESKYGEGRVVWGQDINEVLAGMGVHPDLEFISTNEKTALDYIHRTTDNQEIFFVVNRYARKGISDFKYRYLTDLPDRYEQVECKFRVTGKVPELWDPMTGEITKLVAYREEGGYTIVPLHFEPEESKFIVFREATNQPHIIEIKKEDLPIFPSNQFETKNNPYIEVVQIKSTYFANIYEFGEYDLTWYNGKTVRVTSKKSQDKAIEGSWNVYFDPHWGGPGETVFDELKSWTESNNDNIRYYSGTAVYKTSFFLSSKDLKNKRIFIDLGNVHDMASVKINGQQMPVKWIYPFRYEVTGSVKAGENKLEVEVVNMWPNRLIGDSKLPQNERLTKTNVKNFDIPDSEKFIRESGLLGPVKLLFIPLKRIK